MSAPTRSVLTVKKSKFTEEQIRVRPTSGGTPPGDVCGQLGVSEATFYIWKKKYAPPACERAAQVAIARGRERGSNAWSPI